MKISLRSKRSFTLTETIFSLALLITVWITAVNAILIARSSGSFAKHKIQAMYVMQRTIEDLRKKPFSTIAGSTSTVSLDTLGTPDATGDDLLGAQVVTVTSPSTYYKKVLAQITWVEVVAGKSKSMVEVCGTYIANDAQAN